MLDDLGDGVPMGGPITNVRRISMSRVPCRISPASGGLFDTTCASSTRMTMQETLYTTRMAMGRVEACYERGQEA